MHIERVRLDHVRGFRNLDVRLARPDGSHAGWTVFTGVNGSGKTTLLRAVAVALAGAGMARALQPSFHRWIGDGDVANGRIELTVAPDRSDDAFMGTGGRPPERFAVALTLAHDGTGRDVELVAGTGRTPARQGPWSPGAGGWFCCGYGPLRRLRGASLEAMRLMAAPVAAQLLTLFQEGASLAEADRWLRILSHRALEGRPDAQAQLELVLAVLGDGLLPETLAVDRVDSDGLWLKECDGLPLSWNEMGEGCRCTLALVTDILRHLIDAYGVRDLAGRGADGRPAVMRSGVVLIDEIEAHLGPAWQSRIGSWLTRVFPRIQFLVTTHSPIVCEAADVNGLILLPKPGGDDAPGALSTDEHREVTLSGADTILPGPMSGPADAPSPRAMGAP